MRNPQLYDVSCVEGHVRMPPHSSDDRTLRDGNVFENAAVSQLDRHNMHISAGLGLIEKNLP